MGGKRDVLNNVTTDKQLIEEPQGLNLGSHMLYRNPTNPLYRHRFKLNHVTPPRQTQKHDDKT